MAIMSVSLWWSVFLAASFSMAVHWFFCIVSLSFLCFFCMASNCLYWAFVAFWNNFSLRKDSTVLGQVLSLTYSCLLHLFLPSELQTFLQVDTFLRLFQNRITFIPCKLQAFFCPFQKNSGPKKLKKSPSQKKLKAHFEQKTQCLGVNLRFPLKN